MKRFIFLIYLISVILTAAPAASAPSPSPQKIRIAAFNFYPTLFQAKDGSVQGFYVDFLAEIARREGWKIEYVYGNWADGIARLRAGQVDLLTNVAFTKERAEFMDYGKVPLLTVWSELYVPEGSDIDTIRQVRGRKVALMKGDFNAANFRSLVEKLGIPCTYVEMANFQEIFSAISSRRVDAGIVNNTYGAAKQREYRVKSTGVVFNPFDIYFATAKGKNGAILAALDRYLADWRKTEGSPYHRARERWSHRSVATMPVVPASSKRTILVLGILTAGAAVVIIVLRNKMRSNKNELNRQQEERRKLDDALLFVNNCGATHRGDELLGEITRYVAQQLSVAYVFVGQLLPDRERVRTRGLYADGKPLHVLEYDLHGAPCAQVIGKSICFYPRDVASLFPDDPLLVELNATGYAATPLWDTRGEPIGLMVVISKRELTNKTLVEAFLQITATRAAQELEAIIHLDELQEREFFFRQSQRAAHIGSYKADLTTGTWRSSEVMDEIFGIDDTHPKTVEGWLALVHPEEREMMRDYLRINIVENGQPFDREYRVIRASDGEVRWVLGLGEVARDAAGSVVYLFGTIQDITRRRAAEEEYVNLQKMLNQAQKLESVGRLAGGIAHDFNNKLTVILGYAELLRIASCDKETRCSEYIGEIIKAANHSREITRRLLAFSHNDVASPVQLDLNRSLSDIQKTLGRMIGEQIRLDLDLQQDIWPIWIDPTQLDQVITNLVVNARDAMPNGGTVTLATKNITNSGSYAALPGGEYVLLSCEDRGCGMDAPTLEHIFEPFFTTKGAGKGTGLGLYSVYAIISQNNGHISVQSDPGKGTTFSLFLPRAVEERRQMADEGPVTAIRGEGTVLLVEDEEPVRQVIRLLLENLGYRVVVADSPETALHICRDQSLVIDCVLSDVVMPGMDGRELQKCIRTVRPDLPFLFISGYPADICFDVATEVLKKPPAADLLNEKLSHLIQRRAAAPCQKEL
jgi:PAS domain S-box-containing protein